MVCRGQSFGSGVYVRMLLRGKCRSMWTYNTAAVLWWRSKSTVIVTLPLPDRWVLLALRRSWLNLSCLAVETVRDKDWKSIVVRLYYVRNKPHGVCTVWGRTIMRAHCVTKIFKYVVVWWTRHNVLLFPTILKWIIFIQQYILKRCAPLTPQQFDNDSSFSTN